MEGSNSRFWRVLRHPKGLLVEKPSFHGGYRIINVKKQKPNSTYFENLQLNAKSIDFIWKRPLSLASMAARVVTWRGAPPIAALLDDHFRWCFLSVFVNWGKKIGSATRYINPQKCLKGRVSRWICTLALLSVLMSAKCACEPAGAGEDGVICAVGADPARPAWLLLCCLRGGWGFSHTRVVP